MLKEDVILLTTFRLGCLIATVILFSDCAVTPIEVKSEVVNPAELKRHTVAVIPDPFTDDLTGAQRLVDLVRQEMVRRGFRLSQSEQTAELVVIPHLETPGSGDAPAKPLTPAPRLSLFMANMGEPGMMRNGGELGDMPTLRNQPVIPPAQIQLNILAVQQNIWRQALNVDQLRIPPVWRISVSAPPEFSPKGKEVTAEMVAAAGPKFAAIAGAH